MAGQDWDAIDAYDVKPLESLFEGDEDRLAALTLELGGLYFDWSKTHLDEGLLDRFVAIAEAKGFASARDALFAGAAVNPTEGRPAEHVAERGTGAPGAVELAAARRARMRALVDAIEAGAFGDVTGVLHIGIGGSVLGPALLVDALGRRSDRLEVRFLSNIDGEAFDDAVSHARSRDDSGRGRIEDLHHGRDDGQYERRARLASRGVAWTTRSGG